MRVLALGTDVSAEPSVRARQMPDRLLDAALPSGQSVWESSSDWGCPRWLLACVALSHEMASRLSGRWSWSRRLNSRR
jgi:hypothetical protein